MNRAIIFLSKRAIGWISSPRGHAPILFIWQSPSSAGKPALLLSNPQFLDGSSKRSRTHLLCSPGSGQYWSAKLLSRKIQRKSHGKYSIARRAREAARQKSIVAKETAGKLQRNRLLLSRCD